MASQRYKACPVITARATAFTICFIVWMLFAEIGIPISKSPELNQEPNDLARVSLMWTYLSGLRPMDAQAVARQPADSLYEQLMRAGFVPVSMDLIYAVYLWRH